MAAPNYEFQEITQGSRDGGNSILNEQKEANSQVRLIFALLTMDHIDRFVALTAFAKEHQIMAKQVLQNLETVILAYEARSTMFPMPPPEDGDEAFNHPLILDFEPQLYRLFVGQWLQMIIEKNLMEKLGKWRIAAQKAFDRRMLLHSTFEPISHGSVFAAIKKAALDNAGVPSIKLVEENWIHDLKMAGITPHEDNTPRSIMNTLGFSWIPENDDWEKHWKQHRP